MQVIVRRWFLVAVVIVGLSLGACSPSKVTSQNTTDSSTAATTGTSVAQVTNPQIENLPRLDGKATVVLTVKDSPITIEVDGTNAPITAGNFVDLVERDFYDGLVFHRVVREPQPFVVQGGDPQGKDPNVPVERLGTGSFTDPKTGQPRYIPLEIKPKDAEAPIYSKTLEQAGISAPPQLQHTRGAVAMARSSMPDSASSQFYIALSDLPFLDGSYAVFGYVKNGMDVVDTIQVGDRIESAEVTQGLENLKRPESEAEASP
ncbi:MAG: peptidylprolyl isomerase [Coleofasciculus sp. D1-CHI-01]|uniref:peptidylprolyl isomerase n=1 Tax=Coleofasciculus sp. D1-CHI-01 TaxID=3068482 RepID=UPI0032F81B60